MDNQTAGEIAKVIEQVGPATYDVADAAGVLDVIREQTGLLYDRLHYRRELRRVQLVQATAEQIRASGLPIGAVSDRLLREVLESGSNEDDAYLGTLWSNLLANVLTDFRSVPRAFPEVMRQLEPAEARFLREVASQQGRHLPGSWVEMRELQDVPDVIEWRHLDNLERLSLLSFETSLPNNVELPERPPREGIDVRFSLTPFGEAFLAAATALPV